MRENKKSDDYNADSVSDTSPTEEVLWHINYAISDKFSTGVSFIDIAPPCFGSGEGPNYSDGCVFHFKSIASSSFYKTTLICSPVIEGDPGAIQKIYIVKAPGKREMLLSYVYDAGSAGGSSSVTLEDPSKQDEDCK